MRVACMLWKGLESDRLHGSNEHEWPRPCLPWRSKKQEGQDIEGMGRQGKGGGQATEPLSGAQGGQVHKPQQARLTHVPVGAATMLMCYMCCRIIMQRQEQVKPIAHRVGDDARDEAGNIKPGINFNQFRPHTDHPLSSYRHHTSHKDSQHTRAVPCSNTWWAF